MKKILFSAISLILSSQYAVAADDGQSLGTHAQDREQKEALAAPKPCGFGTGLSIADRISDCGNISKKVTTGQTFTLVAKVINSSGKSLEYLRDDSSKLIFGPEADPKDVEKVQKEAGLYFVHRGRRLPDFRKAAIEYCKSKKELGLKWHLATRDEFSKAGNKDNKYEINPALNGVLTKTRNEFWRTDDQEDIVDYATYYAEIFDRIAPSLSSNAYPVHCVAVGS